MNTVISDLICLARYEILIQITTNIGQLQKWSSFDLCLGIKNETKYYGSSNKKATEFLFFFFSCFKFKMSFSQVSTYMVSYVQHQCSDTSQYNPHTREDVYIVSHNQILSFLRRFQFFYIYHQCHECKFCCSCLTNFGICLGYSYYELNQYIIFQDLYEINLQYCMYVSLDLLAQQDFLYSFLSPLISLTSSLSKKSQRSIISHSWTS